MADALQILKKIMGGQKTATIAAGTEDLHDNETPWDWEFASRGLIKRGNEDPWLYMTLPESSILDEQKEVSIEVGHKLKYALETLAQSSGDSILASFIPDRRNVHILAISQEERPRPPLKTAEHLREYLDELYKMITYTKKTVLIGVQLNTPPEDRLKAAARELGKTIRQSAPDLEKFEADLGYVKRRLDDLGCTIPTYEEWGLLTGTWYAPEPQALLEVDSSGVVFAPKFDYHGNLLEDGRRMEFRQLLSSGQTVTHPSEGAQWLAHLASNPDAPEIISWRFVLSDVQEAQKLLQSASKRLEQRINASIEAGELAQGEDRENANVVGQLADLYSINPEPVVLANSIVFGKWRLDGYAPENTWNKWVLDSFQKTTSPLTAEQHHAFLHCLPCAPTLLNPSRDQAYNLASVGHAGITDSPHLGDDTGLFMGTTMRGKPVYMNPTESADTNESPTLISIGDPGSGKTYTAQSLMIQNFYAGSSGVFFNPKPQSLAAPFLAAGGSVIRVGRSKEQTGMLDPARWEKSPEDMADLAVIIIGAFMPRLLQDELAKANLQLGMRKGFLAGAKCIGDALSTVATENPGNETIARIIETVRKTIQSNPLFGVFVGDTPLPPLKLKEGNHLILVELEGMEPPSDSDMSNLSDDSRYIAATITLSLRFAATLLERAGGGILIADEAYTFLKFPAAATTLDRIALQGRSLNIKPMFFSQKATHFDGTALSPVQIILNKIKNPDEAALGLTMAGFDPTEQRIRILAQAGATKTQRPMAYFMDIKNRHGLMRMGPVTAKLHRQFSTNRLDRLERDGDLLSGEEKTLVSTENLFKSGL